MILKIFVVAAFFCASWLEEISAVSYSKVYLQSGTNNLLPLEYAYGAPGVPLAGTQVARLTAPPEGSVVPLPQVSSFLAPCIAPCIIQGQPIAPVENARLVTFKSPRVPVAVTPTKDEPTSYEYSYIVYDEGTGDQKAQKEQSDGKVVRGQYSLIQPDGYVREVKYTADDEKGFNAVVKNFLPETNKQNLESQALVEVKTKEQPKTPETKSEEPKSVKEIKTNEVPAVVEAEKPPTPPVLPEATAVERADVVEVTMPTKVQKPEEPTKAEITDVFQPEAIGPVLPMVTDIIKCIQEAIKKYNNSGQKNPSPLTYIILPPNPDC